MNIFLRFSPIIIIIIMIAGCGKNPSSPRSETLKLRKQIHKLERENNTLKKKIKELSKQESFTEHLPGKNNDATPPPVQKYYLELKKPFILGSARLIIDRIHIGKNRYLDEFGDRVTSNDVFLSVKISIENISENSKISYSSTVFLSEEMMVTDNWNNRYRLIMTNIEHKEIYPGKKIKDTLYFEKPVATAKSFVLKLNAAIFSAKGVLLLSFRREDIKR